MQQKSKVKAVQIKESSFESAQGDGDELNAVLCSSVW
jgi:hypothetical protein